MTYCKHVFMYFCKCVLVQNRKHQQSAPGCVSEHFIADFTAKIVVTVVNMSKTLIDLCLIREH